MVVSLNINTGAHEIMTPTYFHVEKLKYRTSKKKKEKNIEKDIKTSFLG